MDEHGYNGWKNYETWCVNLWLTNDPCSDSELADIVSRYRKDDSYRAGKAIEAWVDEMNPLAEDASLFSDLLSAALREVDWCEIFENHKDDQPDDDDDDDDDNQPDDDDDDDDDDDQPETAGHSPADKWAMCPSCGKKTEFGKPYYMGITGVRECSHCQAVYGTCYKGESYKIYLPFWQESQPGKSDFENAFCFNLMVLGSDGVEHVHGFADKTTRKLVQVG